MKNTNTVENAVFTIRWARKVSLETVQANEMTTLLLTSVQDMERSKKNRKPWAWENAAMSIKIRNSPDALVRVQSLSCTDRQ